MILGKRDNMGYAIDPSLIVLLVMAGGGFVLLCVIAAARFWYPADEVNWSNRSPEQDAYMREVRERNIQELAPKGMRHQFDPHHLIPPHARNSQQSSSTSAYV